MAIFGKKEKESSPEPAHAPVPGDRREESARLEVAPPAPVRREVATGTTIGPTIRIKGEIIGDEDVTIEGRVEGILNLNRGLIVGKTGVVEADVRALNVIVHGRVVGNIIAEQKVEIYPSGRLEGNIKSPKISIHEGAHFKGNVDMSGGSGGATMGGPEPVVKKVAFERKV